MHKEHSQQSVTDTEIKETSLAHFHSHARHTKALPKVSLRVLWIRTGRCVLPIRNHRRDDEDGDNSTGHDDACDCNKAGEWFEERRLLRYCSTFGVWPTQLWYSAPSRPLVEYCREITGLAHASWPHESSVDGQAAACRSGNTSVVLVPHFLFCYYVSQPQEQGASQRRTGGNERGLAFGCVGEGCRVTFLCTFWRFPIDCRWMGATRRGQRGEGRRTTRSNGNLIDPPLPEDDSTVVVVDGSFTYE